MSPRPFVGVGGTPEPLAPGVVVSDLIPPNPLWASNGLAFGPDGRLWIAQFLGGTVSALDLATGVLEPVLGPEGPLTAPDDLAFADDGSCHVVDLPPGLVWRRAPDGALSLVTDGIVATRTSIDSPASSRLMRPSCGTRRSAMSRFAMILMRESTDACRTLMF